MKLDKTGYSEYRNLFNRLKNMELELKQVSAVVQNPVPLEKSDVDNTIELIDKLRSHLLGAKRRLEREYKRQSELELGDDSVQS